MDRQRFPVRNVFRVLLLSTALMGAGACTSVPPPRAELAQAQRAVDQAVSENTSEFAALELEKARDKLGMARAEMNAERYVEARRWAEEALVDAELALAKADAEKAARNAEELAKTIERLRDEANRRSMDSPTTP